MVAALERELQRYALLRVLVAPRVGPVSACGGLQDDLH